MVLFLCCFSLFFFLFGLNRPFVVFVFSLVHTITSLHSPNSRWSDTLPFALRGKKELRGAWGYLFSNDHFLHLRGKEWGKGWRVSNRAKCFKYGFIQLWARISLHTLNVYILIYVEEIVHETPPLTYLFKNTNRLKKKKALHMWFSSAQSIII